MSIDTLKKKIQKKFLQYFTRKCEIWTVLDSLPPSSFEILATLDRESTNYNTIILFTMEMINLSI